MAMKEIRMQRRRAAVKYTLRELGELLGVGVSQARLYEQAPEKLSYEQAVRVADWLGCKPRELF